MEKKLLYRWDIKLLLMFTMLVFYQNGNSQCSTTGWQKLSQGENFTLALKADGTIWMWGVSFDGIMGTGSGDDTTLQHPTQIGTDTDWTDISAGRHFVLALKNNGDLYGWGDNDWGNLGNGNQTDVFAPTLISSSVRSFSAGYHHSTIVKTDGTLWGTGYNDWGGLGIGNSIGYVNVFTQESSLATNWAKTTAGYYNSFGIKTDGTLWATGANNERMTGTGLNVSELDDFTQVGTDTNWASVSCGVYHVLGLKTNGKLWGWGASHNGRLGIPGAGSQYFSTPQAIEATNNWTAASAGWDHSSAIRSDGALFCFGSNGGGKSGLESAGDTYNLAPVQVGTDTDWVSISNRLGVISSGAIKGDTTIWAWGADNYYQLGNYDGTATNNHIPTQTTCTDALGLTDFTTKSVMLHPNPAENYIQITTEQTIYSAKVFSIEGKLIKDMNTDSSTLYVGDLAKGTYFLRINNTAAQKFIKN
ncbi:MAG: T9SS type A sorting domain-containing protein [Flavobacterium sp.]